MTAKKVDLPDEGTVPNPVPFLNGWKTYIGAGLVAFGALNTAFHFVPDDVANSIMAFGGALGLVGLRAAVSKAAVGQP